MSVSPVQDWTEHNERVGRENRLDEIVRGFEGAIGQTVEALVEWGMTAVEIAEFLSYGVSESDSLAEAFAAESEPDCICPPELVARGGFKGGCPVHCSVVSRV